MQKLMVLIVSLLAFTLTALADDPVQIMQSLSLDYNSAIPRHPGKDPVYLTQYFVPQGWVKIIRDQQTVGTWDDLIFDKNKPGMVRVLLHPFDKVNAEKIEAALKAHDLAVDKSIYRLPLRLTESRSLLPESVNSFAIAVSPKLSMTHGLGNWQGIERKRNDYGRENVTYTKMISAAEAEFTIGISQLLQKRLQGVSGQYFEIMPERMTISVVSPDGTLDLGETFRDISSLNRRHEFTVPGFINQDLRGGLLMALANGKTSVSSYLKEVEAPIRGRALAEFYALTGFVQDSPHSQNFSLTTNGQFQVTGLKLRDLGDLVPTYDTQLQEPHLVDLYKKLSNGNESLQFGGNEKFALFRHSFLKGNIDNGTIGYDNYLEAEKILGDEFIKELARISGVSANDLKSIHQTGENGYFEGDYFSHRFERNNDIWPRVVRGMAAFRQNRQQRKPNLKTSEHRVFTQVNAKIESDFQKIIIKKLQGGLVSKQDYEYMWSFLNTEKMKAFNSQEIEFITSAILAMDKLPAGRIGFLYSRLKADKLPVFDLLLKRSAETAQLEFIGYVGHFFKTYPDADYFVKTALKTRFENLLRHFAHADVTVSARMFEKLFLVNTIIDPVYLQGTSYFPIIDKLKAVPQKIKDYLTEKSRQSGGLSWIYDKFMNAPVYEPATAYKCSSLF